jgi:hypothetical protein
MVMTIKKLTNLRNSWRLSQLETWFQIPAPTFVYISILMSIGPTIQNMLHTDDCTNKASPSTASKLFSFISGSQQKLNNQTVYVCLILIFYTPFVAFEVEWPNTKTKFEVQKVNLTACGRKYIFSNQLLQYTITYSNQLVAKRVPSIPMVGSHLNGPLPFARKS